MPLILVVEDSATIAEFTRIALTNAGHRVRVAADGDEGLAAFLEERPDLVMTDMNLPKRNGIELIRAMRDHDGSVPIIAMSGGSSPQDEDLLQRARQLGVVHTLDKPFRIAGLLRVVESAI